MAVALVAMAATVKVGAARPAADTVQAMAAGCVDTVEVAAVVMMAAVAVAVARALELPTDRKLHPGEYYRPQRLPQRPK